MSIQLLTDQEKQLVSEYHVTAKHYSCAIGQLAVQLGTPTFTETLKLVEFARVECEHARVALAKFRKPLCVDRTAP